MKHTIILSSPGKTQNETLDTRITIIILKGENGSSRRFIRE